jgi:hypothetical protein
MSWMIGLIRWFGYARAGASQCGETREPEFEAELAPQVAITTGDCARKHRSVVGVVTARRRGSDVGSCGTAVVAPLQYAPPIRLYILVRTVIN